jgi:rubrerythrin
MTPDQLVKRDPSVEGLLRTAIQLEKESILFYLGLAELVAGTETCDYLQQVLAEERGHVAMLSAQLRGIR